MIELIQFPWSPYCLVQRQILTYGQIRCRVVNIPNGDRSLVWKLTKERYYQVPVLRNGRSVLFETGDNSQVIAKYLDDVFELGLFPERWVGIQDLLWPHIEGEIEGLGFKLNDIYWKEFVPKSDRLRFLRHKERRFGRGCLELWQKQQKALLAELDERLLPFEQMLKTRPFLLDETPRFVDFDLYGMLANFLFSGHYRLPARHKRLQSWYERVKAARH
ncbi:MAG: glutathione S-transferase [Verrucomicrobiales bacterium]|nr:glutathione S-transferase [Verrucomicrobiales bacterium]